jgi:hypothetical protein
MTIIISVVAFLNALLILSALYQMCATRRCYRNIRSWCPRFLKWIARELIASRQTRMYVCETVHWNSPSEFLYCGPSCGNLRVESMLWGLQKHHPCRGPRSCEATMFASDTYSFSYGEDLPSPHTRQRRRYCDEDRALHQTNMTTTKLRWIDLAAEYFFCTCCSKTESDSCLSECHTEVSPPPLTTGPRRIVAR